MFSFSYDLLVLLVLALPPLPVFVFNWSHFDIFFIEKFFPIKFLAKFDFVMWNSRIYLKGNGRELSMRRKNCHESRWIQSDVACPTICNHSTVPFLWRTTPAPEHTHKYLRASLSLLDGRFVFVCVCSLSSTSHSWIFVAVNEGNRTSANSNHRSSVLCVLSSVCVCVCLDWIVLLVISLLIGHPPRLPSCHPDQDENASTSVVSAFVGCHAVRRYARWVSPSFRFPIGMVFQSIRLQMGSIDFILIIRLQSMSHLGRIKNKKDLWRSFPFQPDVIEISWNFMKILLFTFFKPSWFALSICLFDF